MVKILSKINAYDQRTTYGCNLKNISISCNTEISDLTPSIVKDKMKYREIPNEESWRLNTINDLLLVREGDLFIPNFDKEVAEDMLNFVCYP